MNKALCLVVIAICILALGMPVLAAPGDTLSSYNTQGFIKKYEGNIRVRGVDMVFSDAPPLIKFDNSGGGRTLIPVRDIMNGLGAEVKWDEITRTIEIIRADKLVILNLKEKNATLNGQILNLEAPAEIINNRTYVPLRFVAQALGENVNYDGATKQINIGN